MPLLGDGGCYLLDFAPYRPPEECRVTESVVREKGKDWKASVNE